MFKGKTALATGSTSGIGLGIARELASNGANLILNGFGNASDIEHLRGEIAEHYGVTVRYDGADMSRHEAIEAMWTRGWRSSAASTCSSTTPASSMSHPSTAWIGRRTTTRAMRSLRTCLTTSRLVASPFKANPMKILVLSAGAIGAYYGARLSRPAQMSRSSSGIDVNASAVVLATCWAKLPNSLSTTRPPVSSCAFRRCLPTAPERPVCVRPVRERQAPCPCLEVNGDRQRACRFCRSERSHHLA